MPYLAGSAAAYAGALGGWVVYQKIIIMCGLCAEGRAVELAKALTIGKPWPPELEDFYLFDVFYVQESQDALSAIQRMENKLTKSVARLEKDTNTLEWQELVQLRVVFCRVIEILVKNGFETHEYNKLCEFQPCFAGQVGVK